MSFTLHTGSWALQAEKLLLPVTNNMLSCTEGKMPYKFGLVLGEQASCFCCHRAGFVPVSEPGCMALSVPQVFHGSRHRSKQWFAWQGIQSCHLACSAVTVTLSAWMVLTPVPHAQWRLLRQAGKGSAHRRCIQWAALLAWESDLGRTSPLTRRVGKAKQTGKKKT